MTNQGFARIYMILAIGCFVAIILIIALYFSLKLNGISLPIVISGLVLVMLGITSFIVSRSHSHHIERNDEE